LPWALAAPYKPVDERKVEAMGNPSTFEREIKAGKILPGMNFNQKVWALTARIPAGQVRTYAWIAHELGSKGYRAVGNALNRNPSAPAVPCHRVVGSNGSLTGFAGGIEKKRKLLTDEGIAMKNGRVVLPK
jgi:methylated-DNA-[protein]-cysteine S-methyltransferase